MAQGSRPARVGDQIRGEVTDLLAREIHDPGLGFLTVTRVDVTPDLQRARVYLHDAGRRDGPPQHIPRAGSRRPLHPASTRAALHLRRVPEVEFHFDQSIEQLDRIEQLLQEIRGPETLPPPTDSPDDGGGDEQ